MNTYRMEPTAEGFRVIETTPDGSNVVIRDFETEAAARIWIVRRATIANISVVFAGILATAYAGTSWLDRTTHAVVVVGYYPVTRPRGTMV
jgi:hypothetical protein